MILTDSLLVLLHRASLKYVFQVSDLKQGNRINKIAFPVPVGK